MVVMGPESTPYEGGFFKAVMKFPEVRLLALVLLHNTCNSPSVSNCTYFIALHANTQSFPNMPPDMIFTSEMWHPNVYEDGKVCISILHPPGTDEHNSQETAEERWRPILGVEQIIISVISMLSDPNDESPANLDAAVQWRNDKKVGM